MSAVILHRTDPVKNMRRFTCSLIYLGNSALSVACFFVGAADLNCFELLVS
jgi:hypothetical protein